MGSSWKNEKIAINYLEKVRGGIPFGVDQSLLMLDITKHFVDNPLTIVDLGCGNGFLAKLFLENFSEANIICIDNSEVMIQEAKKNLNSYKERCQIILGDFSKEMKQLLEKESVDVIISGYAIHHLPNELKKNLYKQIYTILNKGGIFINMEHTASSTPKLEELHDKLFIDHLVKYNNGDHESIAGNYYSRSDKEDNILEKVEIQLKWLDEIGYKHVDCYFKWMELAMFGRVK